MPHSSEENKRTSIMDKIIKGLDTNLSGKKTFFDIRRFVRANSNNFVWKCL